MRREATVQVSSTGSLPAADRFPYWADVITQTFVPLECDTPERQDFSGRIRHRRIGRIGVADVCASAQCARRTRATIARAPCDDMIVVVHIDGPCSVGQMSNVALLGPGDGAIVWAQEAYVFDFPERFRQLVLKVPRSLLRGLAMDEHRRGAFRLGHGPGKLLCRLALATLEGPEDLSHDEEPGIERALAELLRSAVTQPARRVVEDAAASARYAVACTFIRQNLADSALNTATVAMHVGLSPRSLARLFALRGMTVERTIWSERLAAARDDLIDPGLRHASITDIAFSWAFNDAAHFSRSFAKAYGMAPRQFRIQHGLSGMPSPACSK